MRRLAALVLTSLLACQGCSDLGHALPSGRVLKISDRVPAPQLSGTTLDGARLDVRSLRGKVVVLNFWASWCGACRAEAGALNDAYVTTKTLGVEFVGINLKDDRTAALAMQRDKAVAYPSLQDPQGSLLLRFRGEAPQSPPSTWVLDRHGRVALRFLSPVGEAELTAAVTAIAAEST
jgi:peroxiredoxin